MINEEKILSLLEMITGTVDRIDQVQATQTELLRLLCSEMSSVKNTLDQHTEALELLIRGLKAIEKNQITNSRFLREHSEMLTSFASLSTSFDERIERLERV